MKSSSTLIAFISAFALHIILGGLLLIGIDFSLPKEKPQLAVIQASVVNQKLFDDLAQRKKDKALVEQRKAQAIKDEKQRVAKEKAAQEKAQRLAKEKARQEKIAKIAKAKAEEKRIAQAKIAKAKAVKAEAERVAKEKIAKEKADKLAQEKAAKEKAAKLAQEKAAKEKAARLAQEKAAKEKAERLAKEKAAKEKAERLAKEKAAKEKAERLAQEKAAKEKAERLAKEKAAKEKAERLAKEKERQRQAALDKQMEAEFAEEFSSAQSEKQLSEIARYKALIQNKISRNWQVDLDMKGKTCTLAIRLAPDGLILGVERSSGDQQLCDSARRAALKAKTLPIPKDPDIAPQFRDFDITLEPDL